MKKQITLNEAIASLSKSCLKYDLGRTETIDLKTATPKQKYDFWSMGNIVECYNAISIKNGNVYCYHVVKHLKRCGTKYYTKDEVSYFFTIRDGKVKLGKHVFTASVLHPFGIAQWLSGDYRITNATILKAILTSEVYSEESLYKFIAKKIIREDIPWRLLKEYNNAYVDISIYDLKDITTNVPEAMRTIMETHKSSDWGLRSLYHDVFKSAIMLGEKINPKWSIKRLQEEHKRQIREITLAEIDAKDNIDLYEGYEYPYCKHITMLRTERDVFMEASEMHHCIYSNYWSRIKDYRYMAFSINLSGERATMGVAVDNYGQLYLDQIQGPYNRRVSQILQGICEAYIEEHKHVFTDIIKHKHKKRFRPLRVEEPQHVEFDWDNFINEVELP